MSKAIDQLNKKIQKQKALIRSILSDFRKSKHRCIILCQQMNENFALQPQYEAIEKQVNQKFQLVDVVGLVDLKNKLTKSSKQLIDLQSDLKTKKQRIIARNQFGMLFSQNGHTTSKTKIKDSKNMTMQEIKRRASKMQEDQEKNENSNSKTQQNKVSAFNVPLYHIQQDSTENKVQRISKFVASLKSKQSEQVGNMKLHSEDKADQKIKDILHEDPEYLKMKQELERYKMKVQQLQAKIKTIQEKAVQGFLKTAQVVQEKGDYMLIKIRKNLSHKIKKYAIPEASPQDKTQQQIKNAQPIAPRKMKLAQLQQQIQIMKSKRKDEQIQQIQKQLQSDNYNVKSVILKISSTLSNNEEKLRKLREHRMKIFEKEQQVWAQLQQI